MIYTLAIANYRSLREVVIPLDQLTVITGANGSGKSNLYRVLRLLRDTAIGGAIPSLAREGELTPPCGLDRSLLTGMLKRGVCLFKVVLAKNR